MELAMHETENGEVVELLYEWIEDNQRSWVVPERPHEVSFAGDSIYYKTEEVVLDRKVIVRPNDSIAYLCRMGYSNLRHCFLMSRYKTLE